jgi:hypothetical protein
MENLYKPGVNSGAPEGTQFMLHCYVRSIQKDIAGKIILCKLVGKYPLVHVFSNASYINNNYGYIYITISW